MDAPEVGGEAVSVRLRSGPGGARWIPGTPEAPAPRTGVPPWPESAGAWPWTFSAHLVPLSRFSMAPAISVFWAK